MLFLARSLAIPFFATFPYVFLKVDGFKVRSDFAGVFRLCPKLELIAPCSKLCIVATAQSIAEEERLKAGVPTAALLINVSYYLLLRRACCYEKLISEVELLLKSSLNFFL